MWKLVKIPKLLALLGFVLPWMTVSCSGTRLMSATGYGLTFGHITASMPKMSTSSDAHSNVWLVLGLIAIGVGTVLAFRGREMARGVLATSAAALVLIWIGTSQYSKSALLQEASKRTATPFDQTAMAMIQIDWQFGFWLTLAALVAAGVMAWLVLSGRDAKVMTRRETASGADAGS